MGITMPHGNMDPDPIAVYCYQLLFLAQEWYTDVAMGTELESAVEEMMVSDDQMGICALVMQSVEES